MSFLTTDRNTDFSRAEVFEFPPGAGAAIHRGALVAIDAAGAAFPAGPTAGYRVVGVAQTGTSIIDQVPPVTFNAGALPGGIVTAGGAARIRVRRGGCFLFDNSPAGADQLGAGDFGATCYAVDDHTLAKTDGGGTRPAAGTFRGLASTGGAWVQI